MMMEKLIIYKALKFKYRSRIKQNKKPMKKSRWNRHRSYAVK